MIALQHFSLLSPGVFPGWPGPRPPGPTRFEVLNNNLLVFCFLDDSREFPSSSSSSTASSGTTPTITSNRHGGQVPPHQEVMAWPLFSSRVGWALGTTWIRLRSVRRGTTSSSTTSNNSRPCRLVIHIQLYMYFCDTSCIFVYTMIMKQICN